MKRLLRAIALALLALGLYAGAFDASAAHAGRNSKPAITLTGGP
jgi:hypothetical protein